MVTIKVANDFSRFPAGRYDQDGPYSGESFRNNFLIPALINQDQDKIVVELDGTIGYSSSFLEEAFGGLVRQGFAKEDLQRKLEIRASDASLKQEIGEYISEAKSA